MKAFLHSALLSGSLLLGGFPAYAQVYDSGQGRSGRRAQPRQNRNDSYAGGSVMDRVQNDLSRAAANSYTDGHERGHFNKAQQALQQFESRWAQGNFDQGRLDEAINSLQHLVESNQVNRRDRSVLANDLAVLRNFRASRGQSINDGAYGGYGGYSNTGAYSNGGSVIGRVQNDLSRTAANSYTDGHERGHFNKAQQALQQFESRWAQGNFDQGRLDQAISSLQHLVESNQINPRDRSVLANDLALLRNFRRRQ
ncbi:MAG: hypothetical protein JJE04_14550 [Acidobacteriia bacterium]|nr:hypothetical protein [Terriglobia bacterium]